jgi:hypothetical protein
MIQKIFSLQISYSNDSKLKATPTVLKKLLLVLSFEEKIKTLYHQTRSHQTSINKRISIKDTHRFSRLLGHSLINI